MLFIYWAVHLFVLLVIIVIVDREALFAPLARLFATFALLLLPGLRGGDGVQQEGRGGARVEQARLDMQSARQVIERAKQERASPRQCGRAAERKETSENGALTECKSCCSAWFCAISCCWICMFCATADWMNALLKFCCSMSGSAPADGFRAGFSPRDGKPNDVKRNKY